MAAMMFWALEPPAQWKAGTTGDAHVPFYFDCADCGLKEAPIAGILSTDGTFHGIGVLPGDHGFYRPAMFCSTCYAKRLEAATPAPEATPADTVTL